MHVKFNESHIYVDAYANNSFNACTYVRFNSWKISNSHNCSNFDYEAYTIYVESKIRKT